MITQDGFAILQRHLLAQFQGRPLELFPPQASTLASRTDALFWFLTAICTLVGVGIAFFLIFYIIRYRASARVNRDNPPHSLLKLELLWIVIPLFIFIVIFLWSAGLYFFIMRPPPSGTLDIYVMGKQWMWKFQHPTGQREINELHVPVGQKVRLLIGTQDVIHSVFIPAFRIKQDAVPSRYATAWFEATETGKYHLFCAEYCGLEHSRMTGWIYVIEPAEYQQWLETHPPDESMAAAGRAHFTRLGCSGCHMAAGRVGPSLEGLYGSMVVLEDGTRATADYQYIRDSILLPGQRIVAGYADVMPTFAGALSEPELLQLIEYIKSLSQPSEEIAP